MFIPTALLAWHNHSDGHNEGKGEREIASKTDSKGHTIRKRGTRRLELAALLLFLSLSLHVSFSLAVFLPILLLSPTSFTILLSLPAIPRFDFYTIFRLSQCPSEVLTVGDEFGVGWRDGMT